MPSPIAHIGVGYVIYRLSEHKSSDLARQPIGPISVGLFIAVSFSMAADIDSVIGLLSGVALFYGLPWSDGLYSYEHLLTIITEAGFVGLLLLAVIIRRRLQPVEG